MKCTKTIAKDTRKLILLIMCQTEKFDPMLYIENETGKNVKNDHEKLPWR